MVVSGNAICDALVAIPTTASYRASEFKNTSDFKYSYLPTSAYSNKGCSSLYFGKVATGLDKNKSRGFLVRASGENSKPIAPLQLESPSGQLLKEILQADPQQLLATVDQQLENLQNDRDTQFKGTPSSDDNELYRRIAEIKEKDRRNALEDIMYCLIVHRFMEKNIAMFPKPTSSDSTSKLNVWPFQENRLRSVHCSGIIEMIQSHLAVVIGDQLNAPVNSTDENEMIISHIKLGKMYAASIFYGYFLRRVDQQYNLERCMINEDSGTFSESPVWDNVESYVNLRSYVMNMDQETVESYATIRSKEALSLIERQTQALFGQPDIKIADGGELETQNDELVSFTLLGLRLLIWEAVTFGSFLWDAEGHVNLSYDIFDS